ncbi:potassium/proton antiporter [Rhodopila sp.]|uniref:potassium/proton antiporter n=1 Tax=Rhodopila sp. TaxID=2480087 RepID=UPI003D138E36
MAASHEIILVAGVLCLLAIFAGLLSARVGTPLLLVFIAVGMLAGEDGPGGIQFNDFHAAYLVGSLALTAILFQGGLSTERAMIRQALWPSIALATAGVAISAAIVGVAARWLFGFHWQEALLLGAATAPTDAAAVSVLLHLSRAAVPSRVTAALEVESGLNDPMSVFLTVGLVELLTAPGGLHASSVALLFLKEMVGGAAIGLASGYALLGLFRRLRTERSVFPVVAVGGALAIFGGTQVLGASGFLAVYLAGVIVGTHEHAAREPVTRFFGALGWLAQIALFLMLGLLVTPHELPPLVLSALTVAVALIFVARPLAVAACLLPFRWSPQEVLFVSWVGLRGAVPIYLTIIPLLAGLGMGQTLFNIVFVVVIISVAVQGWTITPAARLLRLTA